MIKNISYITYQTFPSEKANTIQTIENLKYLKRKNINIELIYPLREKNSTRSVSELKKYYQFDEEIKLMPKEHFLPFGKIKYFEKYFYLISHLLWAYFITRKYTIKQESYVFTRSDWVFYFLSKKNIPVVFECHQLTNLRNLLMKKSIGHTKSKIIFLNNNLAKDSNLTEVRNIKKVIILHNGVDVDYFKINKVKAGSPKVIIFIGNLLRFNKSRGLEFVLQSMEHEQFSKGVKFKIIGGPLKEVDRLKDYVNSLNLNNRVEILGRLDRESTIKHLSDSHVGLLINSEQDKHSTHHTSPLKYFEYLYAGVNVVAIDYPSHQSLPLKDKINFFKKDDHESFIDAINRSLDKKALTKKELDGITLNNRADKIISFLNH